MSKGSDKSPANEIKQQQTKSCPGQAKFESYLVKRQGGI